MRLPLPLAPLLAALLLAPLAGAEELGGGAGGFTITPAYGVAGAQADEDTAIGVRYWHNKTAEGDSVEVLLINCAELDSGIWGYCERERVLP